MGMFILDHIEFVLHALGYNGTCFDSVRVKHIPKGIRKIIDGSVKMHLQSQQIFLEHKHMI